jgi:hypothetical protein
MVPEWISTSIKASPVDRGSKDDASSQRIV